jgi:ATP-dependent DNA helicase RecG
MNGVFQHPANGFDGRLELPNAGQPTRKDGKCFFFRVWFRVVNLLELLKRPEGKTLEFKRDLSSPPGVLRSIIAFANTAGGTLLIGVEDKSRHVRGIKDPLVMEERLANLVSDNIVPRLAPELEILPWRRTHVLALQAFPSPARPHYLKAAGLENGVCCTSGVN